jgi:hypothetical protein
VGYSKPATKLFIPDDPDSLSVRGSGLHPSSDSSDSESDDTDVSMDSDFDDQSDCYSVGRAEPVEDYDELIKEFAEEGPTLANRGEATEAMIRTEEAKWIQ